MRYYYKRIDKNKIIYESRTFPSLLGEEITEEEYNASVAEIEAMIEAENEKILQTIQKRINQVAELEEENASLLYKLLTGEDLEE